jgi:hypothetical protein
MILTAQVTAQTSELRSELSTIKQLLLLQSGSTGAATSTANAVDVQVVQYHSSTSCFVHLSLMRCKLMYERTDTTSCPLLLCAMQAQSSDSSASSSGLASVAEDSTTATDSSNATAADTAVATTTDTTASTTDAADVSGNDAATSSDSSTTPEEAAALAAAAEQARHLEAERLVQDRAAKLAAVTAALTAMHSGNAAADLKAGVPMLRVSHLAVL